MEYYLDMRRKEILPLAATWMDPESIILSEIDRKRKTDTIWYQLICGIYKPKLTGEKKQNSGGQGLEYGGNSEMLDKEHDFQL